jgi:hypothetical protein
MPIHRLIVLIIAATTLAACGGAPVSQGGSSAPPAAIASTAAPTTVTAPTAAHTATFEGLASGLDNMKQARIRATSAVVGTPNVDVYINGLPAFNGGKAQQNMGVGEFSGWLYVTPGTYTVALVPHGGTLVQALFAPVAVSAAAGHRYTIAAIGQLKDKDVKPLVVDETALVVGIGAKPTDNVIITLNNLKGPAAIDELLNGKPGAKNVKYGETQAWLCNHFDTFHDVNSITGKPEVILGEGDTTCEPGSNYTASLYGSFPGGNSSNASQGMSEANTLDFLAGFNSYNVSDHGHIFIFKTLLAAIDTAGLRNLFASSDPYFFLAPTDEAFAALPKAQRDALLNDPQALIAQLKAHTIDGYYPYGSFSGATYGEADRTVTNRLGQKLTFQGDSVNGRTVGPNYTVGNGNRMQVIYTLLPAK